MNNFLNSAHFSCIFTGLMLRNKTKYEQNNVAINKSIESVNRVLEILYKEFYSIWQTVKHNPLKTIQGK